LNVHVSVVTGAVTLTEVDPVVLKLADDPAATGATGFVLQLVPRL
jgi:hypothetical protein